MLKKVCLCAVILIFGFASVNLAAAQGRSTVALAPDTQAFGMSYGDWGAAWWQYVLNIPTSQNPLLDDSGTNCDVNQSGGPVFFLVGTVVSDPVVRNCSVRPGKAIFFPIINTVCATALAPDASEADLRTCAGEFVDSVDISSLHVSVDGRAIDELNHYRAQSPAFQFTLPSENIFAVPEGTYTGVADGYWILLRPLVPGAHVVEFRGACSSGTPCEGFDVNVTYNLAIE